MAEGMIQLARSRFRGVLHSDIPGKPHTVRLILSEPEN